MIKKIDKRKDRQTTRNQQFREWKSGLGCHCQGRDRGRELDPRRPLHFFWHHQELSFARNILGAHDMKSSSAAIKFVAAAFLFSVGQSAFAFDGNAPAPSTCQTIHGFFDQPLPHISEKFLTQQPIRIVALGSSSTEGIGASTKAHAYPSVLQSLLDAQHPGRFVVINRGVGLEELADMAKRLNGILQDDKPDLVILQFGVNSVLGDQPLAGFSVLIDDTIARIRQADADVVIMNSQYAPKVLEKPGLTPTLQLMADAAKRNNINLVDRFRLMQNELACHPNQKLVGNDGIHLNDEGYALVARHIFEALKRPPLMTEHLGIQLTPP